MAKNSSIVWQWTQCGGVVAWNSYTLYRAYRTRPIYGSSEFWPDLKSWLTKYNPTFCKVAAASPPEWDDRITAAIDDVLHDPILWGVAQGTISLERTTPDNESRQTIREWVRNRLKNRFLKLNVTESLEEMEARKEQQAESIATAIMVLSLIASSTNIFQFVRNWRKARGGQ